MSELLFTNPMSIVIAEASLGSKVEKARFALYPRNQRWNQGNRNHAESISVAAKFSDILEVSLDTITYEESATYPAPIIEAGLKRKPMGTGQTLIMSNSDMYCRFGFPRSLDYILTKRKLKRLFNKVYYDSHDHIIGFNLKDLKTNLRCTVSDIDILETKKLLRKIILQDEFKSLWFLSEDSEDKYLLVCPYRHDAISSKFTGEFFKKVREIAERKKLRIIVKNHPNDTYDYRSYLPNERKNLAYQDSEARHVPVEMFLQSKNIAYTVACPSSSLAFADASKLLVLVSSDRDLYRRKFLDQSPFLERLNLGTTSI
jgi:hypothetical protein